MSVKVSINDSGRLKYSAFLTLKELSPKQVADLLGHSTSQITEMYYVKKDTTRLNGITDGFEI